MRQSASLALHLYGADFGSSVRPLQNIDAKNLFDYLISEASEYFYSAYVSICDGLRGVCGGLYSLATVKFYYSTFYSVHALLARSGYCIYYNSRKPRVLYARPGSKPEKSSGNTHEIVWDVYARNFPNSVLLNPVNEIISYKWLKELREEANYRNRTFWEPIVPNHFSLVNNVGVLSSVNKYVNDTLHQYAFDKDHAAIAFPIECLKQAFRQLQSTASGFEDEKINFLKSCIREAQAQALAPLILR